MGAARGPLGSTLPVRRLWARPGAAATWRVNPRRKRLVPRLFTVAKPRGGNFCAVDAGEGCYVISSRMNAAHQHHQPKLSRNQSEILSCLRKAKEPMSAYAILDRVRTAGISHPPTVYRALADLMQKGMVHRLESRSAFIACGHGGCDGKFAFAICRHCGKVVEIPLSDDDQAALLGLVPDEIAPERVTLEIAGLCEACRAA